MVTVNAKIGLFHVGCLTVRIGLVLLLYFYPYAEMASFCFLFSAGFVYQAQRKKDTGGFGSKVYWPRHLHAITYALTGILLLIKTTRRQAFWGLAADIILGYLVFWHHYQSMKDTYSCGWKTGICGYNNQNRSILLSLVGLYVYALSKSITSDFYESRGWFLGAYSGLTLVYSVQPKCKYEQIFVQCIGTICMLVDVKTMYAYVGYPVMIVWYLGMEIVACSREKKETPLI